MRDVNKNNNIVASWIVKFLKSKKVDTIFGLQGGHIQPIWDFCYKLGIKIIDVRDEKAAVHMAQAYSFFTGKIGVVLVTAGPGVTNTVTGVANAFLSSTPILVIGGCPPTKQKNKGPLQDIPHIEILKSITRYARTASVSSEVIREINFAYSCSIGQIAPPGPSYIEIPTNILRKNLKQDLILEEFFKEEKKYIIHPNPKDIELAIETIQKSKKPILISGRGAKGCSHEIERLITKTDILYLDTQESRGLVSYKNSNNVYAARGKAFSEADLVILVGRKLDYQLAFGSKAVFKNATFIRISDSTEELIDNRRGFPEIYADPALTLKQLLKKITNTKFNKKWIKSIKKAHLEKINKYKKISNMKILKDGKINPAFIFDVVYETLGEDFIGIADGGDFLSFARVGLKSKYYLDSGAFGCLGTGLPYAISAAKIFKNKKVICFTGDGAFGFNAMELDTAVRNKCNVCIIISNNAAWSIETHDQKLNYGNRVYGTSLRASNYAKLAEGLGCKSYRIERPDEFKNKLKEALENTPSVIDVTTSSLALSSDAKKGLGLVPDYQALEDWDELEKTYRKKNKQ